MTAFQRWKARRDLIIYLAHRHGVSTKMLADVFDLAPSRASRIVRDFREAEKAETGPFLFPPGSDPFKLWIGRKLKETGRKRGRRIGSGNVSRRTKPNTIPESTHGVLKV